jgi:hypothetical protein
MNNTEAFLNYVQEETSKNGVVLHEEKGSFIAMTDSIKCSGYFDSEGDESLGNTQPTLAYSRGREDWMEILAHEFCHMTQWIDEIPEWAPANESIQMIDRWLNGEDVEDIDRHINVSRDLELDNEKRTVKLLQKFELPVDIGLYVRKSNAYVLFYNWMKETRKWSNPENSPYKNENVIKAMSEKFDMNYESLDEHIREIYKQENI